MPTRSLSPIRKGTGCSASRPSRVLKKLAAATLATFVLAGSCARAAGVPVVVVPLDDRPVTLQLPRMLGEVAGIEVRTPPRRLLGNYLVPGDPDGLSRWLSSGATRDADAFVLSTDMLVYGGLVASRVPGVPNWLGYSRLRDAAALREQRPGAAIFAFGTVMRLAPTGVPSLGAAAPFFAAGEAWPLLQTYANLPDPPAGEALDKARRLRERLGPLLDDYLATRRRNLDVDLFALRLTAEGGFDRLVLGQDDAGPQGLHIRDLADLRAARERDHVEDRAAIEPGADELGMALEAAAFARRARWTPAVRVVYSTPDGARFQDPLEFAPVDTTAGDLIRTCGGRRVAGGADIDLYIKVTGTTEAQERIFIDGIAASVAAGRLTTVADLTFLRGDDAEQRALVEHLIERGLAGRLAGFASWNTAANSLGTALPAAIAVGTGTRLGSFDRRALAQFLLDRYVDDYAFHQFVRPVLIADLVARKIDRTYLLPDVAASVAAQNRHLLWPHALDLLHAIFPEYRDAGLTITLPWDRTFETRLDVRLAAAAPST